jgi:hypothetical protein
MSAKKRIQSAREMKDKRAKRLAIGGVVVLAAVLAFEVPKVMKHGSGSAAPPAATTTTTTSVTGVSTPTVTPAGTPAPVAPTGSTKLPNSDAVPRSGKSQLFSFSHFTGKDPFLQQVSGGGAAGAPSGGTGNSTPGVITAASVSHKAARRGSASQAPRTLAVAGSVQIAVNGRPETVRVGASFPSANPLFKLVSINRGGIRIGIASGSYTSGAQTVSLSSGRSLTLVDTADGIHYKIRLLSAS